VQSKVGIKRKKIKKNTKKWCAESTEDRHKGKKSPKKGNRGEKGEKAAGKEGTRMTQGRKGRGQKKISERKMTTMRVKEKL